MSFLSTGVRWSILRWALVPLAIAAIVGVIMVWNDADPPRGTAERETLPPPTSTPPMSPEGSSLVPDPRTDIPSATSGEESTEEEDPTDTGPATDGDAQDGSEAGNESAAPPTWRPPSPDVSPRDRARELVQAGDRAYASGQVTKAESSYEAALETYPRAHAAAAGLGKISFNKANYPAAARRLAQAVSISGRNSKYRIQYGDALYKLGKYAEAKKQYEKAQSLGNSMAAGRLKKTNEKLGG